MAGKHCQTLSGLVTWSSSLNFISVLMVQFSISNSAIFEPHFVMQLIGDLIAVSLGDRAVPRLVNGTVDRAADLDQLLETLFGEVV
jgi:hypothetical protein